VKEALESAGFEVAAEKRRRQEFIDGLTGLYSELYIENVIEKEMAAARRYNKVFSVLLIDVDNFSQFNKRFGRESGDRAIREIASIFLQSIRISDVATRLDEEKFCLMLPLTKASESMLLAERLRRKVEAREFDGDENKRLTISIGITEFRNEDAGPRDVLARGMEGARRVKERGKNNSLVI
jgi:diguanylate cyclase (GGDEF)-like protein